MRGVPVSPASLRAVERRQVALAEAEARMRQAKHAFSLAALACLRGAIDAEHQVSVALAQVDAARVTLRTIADDLNDHPPVVAGKPQA